MNLPLHQAIEKMQQLLAQGRFAEAHRLVEEQLAAMPRNPLLLRWKAQIEARASAAGVGTSAPPESPIPPSGPRTERPVAAPAVLLVGCSAEFGPRCRRALADVAVVVRDCELARLATLTAAWRPLAIVVPEDVYSFDPDELEALARDVGARIIRFQDEETSLAEVSSAIRAASSED